MFLPVQAKAMKNIEAQLFPHQTLTVTSGPIATIHTNDSECIKFEANVQSSRKAK